MTLFEKVAIFTLQQFLLNPPLELLRFFEMLKVSEVALVSFSFTWTL